MFTFSLSLSRSFFILLDSSGNRYVKNFIVTKCPNPNKPPTTTTPTAGKIEFLYGEDIGFTRSGFIRQPREKDLYIFPAKLRHLVYPFKSKTERISVSVNFEMWRKKVVDHLKVMK